MYVIETRAQVAAKAKAQAATQVGTSEQGDDVQEPLLSQEDLLSQIKSDGRDEANDFQVDVYSPNPSGNSSWVRPFALGTRAE